MEFYSLGVGATWGVTIFPSFFVGNNATVQALYSAWSTNCDNLLKGIFPLSQHQRLNSSVLMGRTPGDGDPQALFNGSVIGIAQDEFTKLIDSSYFHRIPLESLYYYGGHGLVNFREADEVKSAFDAYEYQTGNLLTPSGPLGLLGGSAFMNPNLSKNALTVDKFKVLSRWVARNSTFAGMFYGAPNIIPNTDHHRLWLSKTSIELLTFCTRDVVCASINLAPRDYYDRTTIPTAQLPSSLFNQGGANIAMVSNPAGLPPPPVAWLVNAGVGRYMLAVNQYQLLNRMSVGYPYFIQDVSTDDFTTAADSATILTADAVAMFGGSHSFRK